VVEVVTFHEFGEGAKHRVRRRMYVNAKYMAVSSFKILESPN
jgi:hypothetical protein